MSAHLYAVIFLTKNSQHKYGFPAGLLEHVKKFSEVLKGNSSIFSCTFPELAFINIMRKIIFKIDGE